MDARDRPCHRCVQVKKKGAKEPLSLPHRTNVWWQIKLLPFCYTSSHFASFSVNSLCGTCFDWHAVALNRQSRYNILNKTNKLKLYEGIVVTVPFVLLFICQFLILIVNDLNSHWKNLLHSYWCLMAPDFLCCSPIVLCKLVTLHFFPRPLIYRLLKGLCLFKLESWCFCAFSLQSLYYYIDFVLDDRFVVPFYSQGQVKVIAGFFFFYLRS